MLVRQGEGLSLLTAACWKDKGGAQFAGGSACRGLSLLEGQGGGGGLSLQGAQLAGRTGEGLSLQGAQLAERTGGSACWKDRELSLLEGSAC